MAPPAHAQPGRTMCAEHVGAEHMRAEHMCAHVCAQHVCVEHVPGRDCTADKRRRNNQPAAWRQESC